MNESASRILAIDYGSVRIGLAVSDPLNIIAQGLKTIPNDEHTLDNILDVLQEKNISTIIIGKPLHLSGSESSKSVEVDEFVKALQEKTDIEINFIDERFTSVMAHKTLLAMGIKKKQRRNKEKIDEIASAILLQGYLDSRKK